MGLVKTKNSLSEKVNLSISIFIDRTGRNPIKIYIIAAEKKRIIKKIPKLITSPVFTNNGTPADYVIGILFYFHISCRRTPSNSLFRHPKVTSLAYLASGADYLFSRFSILNLAFTVTSL